MMKQWKRLAALSSAIVMAAATLTYFPNDTLQNIRLEISASAETTTEPQVWIEDNLTWTLDADGKLTISGTGAMKDYDNGDNRSPVCKNSNVKKVVIEDGVTNIGDSAFYNCTSLTDITIPDRVTSIGEYAFCNCRNLTSITIPDSVTSIGGSAFYNCSSLTSITIPDSVTSIGGSAFESCSSLKSITIPNSVTSIGEWAFFDCSSLTSIKIPDRVTSIGNWTFYNCSSLTSITIPDSVTSIGNYAFEDCSSLTSITIPKSVTSIGSGVFNNCNNLTVYLENGSTLTSNDLGVDESKIVSYSQWNEGNLTWKLDADGTLTISGTGAMKDYNADDNPSPAYNNSKVKKIVIEEGVTSIGNNAFYDCDNLTDVTLQDGVKSIGNAAFIWCNNLTNIVLPNSITSIEGFAFKDCTSLTSITIPDSVTSIGDWTFYNCTSLTSITIPDSVTSIGESAFYSCSGLTSIKIPDSVTSIGDSAFKNCSSLQTISLSCKSSLKKSDFGDQADLVSYTNQHLLTKTEAKDATCTEDGNKEYWTCEHCGKYFLSDDANPATATAVELSETVIPASHKLTKMDAKDATCTESGNKAYWTCEHCGKYFLSDDANSETAKAVELSETVISASHKLTKVEAKAPTCTENGNIEYWTCEHCKKYFLSDDTNPETAKAVEQAETVIPASHKLTKVDAKDATCTESGNKEYWTCEHCKKYFLSDDTNPETAKAVELSETVIPASHKLTKVEAKAPTCTENGNIEYWTCEHCKKYFLSDDTNPETAKAVELSEITIPPIKHSYDKNGFCKNDDTHYQPASYNEESEKYEISNAGQLYWFAEQVNSGDTSLNAVLTTDIVVNETVLAADGSLGADPDTLRMWYPIGVRDGQGANIFKGTFDGQGHTISGLYFSNDSNESNAMCAGLFGVSAGIIQNIGLEDSYFNYYYAKMDGQLIVSGGVAAGICEINDGQIVNCYNAGTILGYGASGICVLNSDNGSIENCYNTGVIRGYGLVAGICNLNLGSMKDCYNNSDITVMTDSTIIDENDEKSYASGICNNNISSGRIENCYHVGQVSGADVNNNICNHNAGQIENSYYDCNICDKDAIAQNESSAVAKNVEGKTTKQFASGEVTYLLNGDQSVRAFYQNLAQNLATEKYPTLNQKSKVVMRLERIYDESFGEDATTNKTYHNAGDTIALETSPDKAYTYQYFVNGKQIEKPNYTLTGNTKMTVKRIPVEIELSEIDTIQLTCQKKMTLDLTAYLKNFADLKPVQFQLATGSKLPDGLKLTEDGMLSGTPKKAATVKTTIVLTAENGATKEMHLVFIVNAPVTTTTTTITTTTTRATTTTKPSKTTTTKATTTTKPNKTTTTKATTTTKPSKTTTTNATTTTKPSKTTTTKVTTTTKPSKITTTKATTMTKPSKTTTTNATTTTKPSKTTTTKATTTTKPSKTTTTNATTTTKPSKTTTTNATTTTKPSKTTTTTITTTTNTAIPSYGDVNLDGKVDILDAVFLNKYLATLIQFSDAQMANADCCQDGVLDDQDTTALMQFIILLIDDLPVQPTEK